MPRQDKGTLSEKVIRRTGPVILLSSTSVSLQISGICFTNNFNDRLATLSKKTADLFGRLPISSYLCSIIITHKMMRTTSNNFKRYDSPEQYAEAFQQMIDARKKWREQIRLNDIRTAQ